MLDAGGYILSDGGWWWVDGGYILAGGEWWCVVVDIFWLAVGVVRGGGYILAGGGWRWMVVSGGGWWWVVPQFSLTH